MPLDTNETNQTISFSKTYKIATPKIFALSTKKKKWIKGKKMRLQA